MLYMNMHAASGVCAYGISNVEGVTAGQTRHNSSNVGGVTLAITISASGPTTLT